MEVHMALMVNPGTMMKPWGDDKGGKKKHQLRATLMLRGRYVIYILIAQHR